MMPPSATHFRALLSAAGVKYRNVELITAKGAPPSIVVLFDQQPDAQRFHSMVSAMASVPTHVAGRGWIVIVNSPKTGSASAVSGQ